MTPETMTNLLNYLTGTVARTATCLPTCGEVEGSHCLRRTITWLLGEGYDIYATGRICAWLGDWGAQCDCAVLENQFMLLQAVKGPRCA
jgi:hypothetical protein